MDDQRKYDIDPKGFKKMNHFKQLQTHNLPTDDVQNLNIKNKIRHLALANKSRTVPQGEEKIPQRIQMHTRVILYRTTGPTQEEDQTEK